MAHRPKEPMDISAPLGSLLSQMLDAAHEVQPDALAALTHRLASTLGVTNTRVWLVDYSARWLAAFAEPDVSPLDVDGTVAGRAYVLGQAIPVPREGSVTLWAPLLDGVDRIGVVEFEAYELDEARQEVLTKLAALLASEIVARGQYTDAMAIARRVEPLSLAAELQWHLVPPQTFTTARVSIATATELAYDIAGDAYDYAMNGSVLHVAMFDAMGHDLDASVVCGMAVGAYRHSRRRGDGLLGGARYIDRIIADRFPGATYVTAVCAELDTETGQLTWVNAGHPDPLLIRDHRIVGPFEAPVRYRPFGLGRIPPAQTPEASIIRLQPGDRVLLYTDGIVDARSRHGQDFGVERLAEFVHRALASDLPNAELVRRLSHAVVDHHGGHMRDDASVVLVHWHPDGT